MSSAGMQARSKIAYLKRLKIRRFWSYCRQELMSQCIGGKKHIYRYITWRCLDRILQLWSRLSDSKQFEFLEGAFSD